MAEPSDAVVREAHAAIEREDWDTLQLRSLDAIHLASALTLAPDIESVVTYDRRLGEAAEASGLRVVEPR